MGNQSGLAEAKSNMKSDEEIYAEVRDDLLRFATSLVGWSQAEDIVSTAVLKTIGSYRLCDLREPRAYLFKAVLNCARDHFRRSKRFVPLLGPTAMGSDPALAQIELGDAIGRLSLRQRAVVFLFYWEGLTTDEIAARLDLAGGTVRRYLFDARNRLEKTL